MENEQEFAARERGGVGESEQAVKTNREKNISKARQILESYNLDKTDRERIMSKVESEAKFPHLELLNMYLLIFALAFSEGYFKKSSLKNDLKNLNLEQYPIEDVIRYIRFVEK